jgi:N-acetylglutamate synthase-like GNAT family acetyltransferase
VKVAIRRATAADQAPITALVRGARLNARGLDWPGFAVAVDDTGTLVGVAQVRPHPDGSRELASLVVAPGLRGHGVATRLVDRLLADEAGIVYAVVDRPYAAHFARWGFRPAEARALPRDVRRTLRVGRVVTAVLSLAARQRIHLVPLARPADLGPWSA